MDLLTCSVDAGRKTMQLKVGVHATEIENNLKNDYSQIQLWSWLASSPLWLAGYPASHCPSASPTYRYHGDGSTPRRGIKDARFTWWTNQTHLNTVSLPYWWQATVNAKSAKITINQPTHDGLHCGISPYSPRSQMCTHMSADLRSTRRYTKDSTNRKGRGWQASQLNAQLRPLQ